MRWHLCPSLTLKHLDDLLSVDRKVAVGINGHTEETRIGLKGVIV